VQDELIRTSVLESVLDKWVIRLQTCIDYKSICFQNSKQWYVQFCDMFTASRDVNELNGHSRLTQLSFTRSVSQMIGSFSTPTQALGTSAPCPHRNMFENWPITSAVSSSSDRSLASFFANVFWMDQIRRLASIPIFRVRWVGHSLVLIVAMVVLSFSSLESGRLHSGHDSPSSSDPIGDRSFQSSTSQWMCELSTRTYYQFI
jgi:hypothetical protein